MEENGMEENSSGTIYFLHSSNSWEPHEKLLTISSFSNILQTHQCGEQLTSSNSGEISYGNEKQIQCNACGKVFVIGDGLNINVNNLDKNRFKCKFCLQVCLQRCSLGRLDNTEEGNVEIGSQIQCNTCGNFFVIGAGLNVDLNKLHKNRFKCKFCFEVCLERCFLGRLDNTQEGNAQNVSQIQCDICEKVFHIDGGFNGFANKQEKIRFKCKSCMQIFVERCSLESHVNIHVENQCIVCKKIYSSRSKLMKHHRQVHREKQQKCLCLVCKKIYTSRSKLIKHRHVHREKQKKCLVCNKSFVFNHELVKHMIMHTGQKCFKCTECDRSFSRKSNLYTHLILHSGKKLYKCSICNKDFAQKSHLKIHVSLHDGKRPYKCTKCSKTFKLKCHLVSHMRLHSGDKPYKCTDCDKAYARKEALTLHIRTHTGEKPHKCSHCHEKFMWRPQLTNHLKTCQY